MVQLIDDPSPLYAEAVGVGPRAGWCLRMVRQHAGLSLEQLAEEIGGSGPTLHRLEMGELRNGSLVAGYERVARLPSGTLRAAIDILHRTFPVDALDDHQPFLALQGVREVSRSTEALLDASRRPDATSADGGMWLDWAAALAPGAVGLPESLARVLVARLAEELGRAVGAANAPRYEALSLLRCSDYGYLVVEVARTLVAEPGVALVNDLMSAIGERMDADALVWCLDLLDDPREHVAVGGALALENLAEISGEGDFWVGLRPRLEEVLARTEPPGRKWREVSHLIRLAGGARRRRRGPTPLAPEVVVRDTSRTRRNRRWSWCEVLAGQVASTLDITDDPMLARLLYEVAFDPSETRAVTATLLVGALPWVAEHFDLAMLELYGREADPAARSRLLRRLVVGNRPVPGAPVKQWLESDGAEEVEAALVLAGRAGLRLDDELVALLVARPDVSSRSVLCAVGLAGGTLARLAASTDEAVRAEARWWSGRGVGVTP